ncbi:serine/threonine-protein kinase [Gemmata sp. JC717]|uniref:Serine/threonine protein kinase n=1 Tax=Gemmata algarum TaxID=2975278 RepID=A0ABU5F6P2_9BACT|nr:serine/threonine-protein kinase [Gemmata algarum]MDY3551278.1 serine/threonine-protein kinase [Gemmata algarum]MDY3562397.1 serine/threonine protein kinase [Gemmata algarum]
MIGARVGNWYVESEIGHGPLGVVYRARGFDDPEKVTAVKVFTGVRDPAAVQRMAAELLPLQRLDHANIARTIDCGTHGGLAFVASEFVAGTDCAKRLEAGKLPWREVLGVAVQAARALKHAHNRNVLHRDLKPANFVIAPDGTLKLLAFGIAKVFPSPPSHVPAIGSAAYLPPETASGKPLTRRSDLYSLGGVLYTLVTGRPPFSAGSVVELMHKQCYTLPERPALLVPDLPAEVDEFVCTLLDKNPARRPATAAALLDELERVRGKLERKGEKLAWPAKLTPDTAEMPSLPAALGGGDADDPAPEPRPLLKRPVVVIPLFVAAAAALVLPFAWPEPSADELFTAARPLVESDNPDDWDAAEKYLEPLARKHADRYKDELAAARRRIRDRRELRRAITEGAKADPRTDAERGYLRGLRLAQTGETAQARQAWEGVVAAFAAVPSEQRWVELARAGQALLAQQTGRPGRPPLDREPVRAALEHAKAFEGQGRAAEAAAVRDAVLGVAGDDPAVRRMVEDSRKK